MVAKLGHMSIRDRRQRELARRQELIVTAAREMAEAEGWDAVTTRKLAETIEYSQPVLYTHFTNRDEIISAVSLQGFTELTATLRAARAEAVTSRERVERLLRAYHTFAATHPRLYEAMFVRPSNLFFGKEETPAELIEAFQELRSALAEIADGRDPDVLAEVTWASLHGLITLNNSGRLRPDHAQARLDYFIEEFT